MVVVRVEPSVVTTAANAEVVMALDEPVMLPLPAPAAEPEPVADALEAEPEPVLLAPDRLGHEVPLKATKRHQHVSNVSLTCPNAYSGSSWCRRR